VTDLQAHSSEFNYNLAARACGMLNYFYVRRRRGLEACRRAGGQRWFTSIKTSSEGARSCASAAATMQNATV
jgi:hypothetical protein